jgi:hypothetical protein
MPPKPAPQQSTRSLRSSSKTAPQQPHSADRVGPVTAETASSIPTQPPVRPRSRPKATKQQTEAPAMSQDTCAQPAPLENPAAGLEKDNDSRTEREASNSEPLTSAEHTEERDISETRVSAVTLPDTSSWLTVVPLPGSHPPQDSACRNGPSGCRSRHPRGIRNIWE